MPQYLADSHTHLDQYQPEEVPDILQRAGDSGVELVVTAGVTEESSLKCIDLANRYDSIYAGVGIHPMDVAEPMSEAAYQRFRSMALDNPKVVCISEVGLDFSEGMPDQEMQVQVLRQHVRLARELDLPVVFHSREYPGRMDDHYRTLQVLQEENVHEVGGAMHYFQWDADVAKVCLEMGLTVSIGKPLLRLPQLQETVKDIPLGQHCSGDRCLPAILQAQQDALDGAQGHQRRGREAGRVEGALGERGGKSHHRQSPAGIEGAGETARACVSRRKTARRLIPLSLTLAFICVTLGGLYMTGFIERRLIYHPEKHLTSDPSILGLAYEDVFFTASDGVQLHGWYVPGSRDVTFLWFHGNAGNISHRLGNLKEMHNELAVNIFIFDYRGYGQSRGTPSEQGTYLDAIAALNYLKSREDVSIREIVYYGRSLGGAIAVELATQEPPYGLVLESSFPSVTYMAQKANPLPLWRLLRTKYDSAAKVPRLQMPLYCKYTETVTIPSPWKRVGRSLKRPTRPRSSTLSLAQTITTLI